MILSCNYHQDIGDFESILAKKLNSAMNKKEKTEMKNHTMNAVIAGVRGWVQTRPYNCELTCFHKQDTSGKIIFTNFNFIPDGSIDVYWDEVTNVRETVDVIIDRISKIHDAYLRPLPKPNSPIKPKSTRSVPDIEKVIFNYPATIIFWKDGTKTVVKCSEDDEFNPEVGMAMAIAKKALGNKGNYCNEFKKWVEPYYETESSAISLALKKLGEALMTHMSGIMVHKTGDSESIKTVEDGKAIGEGYKAGMNDVSESDKVYCDSCKYQGVSYYKEPCESCLEAYYTDGSCPSWTPKD